MDTPIIPARHRTTPRPSSARLHSFLSVTGHLNRTESVGLPRFAVVTEGTLMTFGRSMYAAVELADVAQDLAGLTTIAEVRARVTELAAKLFPCIASDLVRVDNAGNLRILASSDPGLSHLTEAAWKACPHQPIPAGRSNQPTLIRLQRSSYLQHLRAPTMVTAELMVPLIAGGTDHGHLRLMLGEPFATRDGRAVVDAYAVHAALAIDRAVLASAVTNLEVALEGNRKIGAAVGVLMALDNTTYDQGLSRLTMASQQHNRKLRDIAADVLYTGEIGTGPVEARN